MRVFLVLFVLPIRRFGGKPDSRFIEARGDESERRQQAWTAYTRRTVQKNVVPMFHVTDVRRTVDWYRDIGFEVKETYGDGGDGLSFAIVAFGAGEVMFSSGGRLGSKHRREVDLYVYTEEVDDLHDRIKDRIEIIEGPRDMFYAMREVIVRDLNGFWITFGQAIPADVLTPWPSVDSARLQPYQGRYESDSGSVVLITIHEGRLLAFPDDASGVFLKPKAEHTFTPAMSQPASVSFEGGTELMTALTFEQDGKAKRFVRAR
jgi:catechol 2,3-dioxygenase-like lactoylglutathione lyase family enzyme